MTIERAVTRRLPIGAEVQADGDVHFRFWAPACTSVSIVLVDESETGVGPRRRPLTDPVRLARAPRDGYFEGSVPSARIGSRYFVQLGDSDHDWYPDPASRFQPYGPHGPSEVVDPTYTWHDDGWRGLTAEAPVIYELHIGTFTLEGTFLAAARELPALAELGISTIEVLPLSEFPGRFGWGYDGVLPFAPSHTYGRPEDLRAFVDAAHWLGLAVILDVVYNHFGPDGCVVQHFAPQFFSDHPTEWGDGLNFDAPGSAGVREFVRANARYWITEFHLDGLRLDATQAIEDRSTPHILAEIVNEVRESGGHKKMFIVGENEPQHSHLMRPQSEGGYGLDALWNDDFHHSAMVALTGRREAYYTDYLGAAQEFVTAARHGFLYQGQWYSWQMQPRGSSTRGLPASAFVAFLQNHDQVANSLAGRRVHELASPGRWRALTALLLLGPWTPMLFQGQEFAASSPFCYFADHRAELADSVRTGRVEFLAQFPSLAGAAAALVPDPGDEQTFVQCKLNHEERASHATASALHRSLIALRRDDPAFHDRRRFDVDAAVLTPEALVLRFFARPDAAEPGTMVDRLLIVNLGVERSLPVAPEPLLSPFPARRWLSIWSSDEPAFGGSGVSELMRMDGWHLPAESATVLAQPPHRR